MLAVWCGPGHVCVALTSSCDLDRVKRCYWCCGVGSGWESSGRRWDSVGERETRTVFVQSGAGVRARRRGAHRIGVIGRTKGSGKEQKLHSHSES